MAIATFCFIKRVTTAKFPSEINIMNGDYDDGNALFIKLLFYINQSSITNGETVYLQKTNSFELP